MGCGMSVGNAGARIMKSISEIPLDKQIQHPALLLSTIEIKKLKEQSTLTDWVIESFEKEFVDQRCFSMNLIFVSGINRDKALIQFKYQKCELVHRFKIHVNSVRIIETR